MGREAKAGRLSKNQRRRQKAKEGKQVPGVKVKTKEPFGKKSINGKVGTKSDISKLEIPLAATIDIVVEDIEGKEDEYKEFQDVFDKFTVQITAEEVNDEIADDHTTAHAKQEGTMEKNTDIIKNEVTQVSPSQEPETLSKRKFMELHSIPLSDLKSITAPYNYSVSWQDTNAPDAYLHAYLKTMHNVVPIPRHWVSKKGFLSSKRGERRLFELPSFIKATGIAEMRGTDTEGNEDTLKQRMRARVQPKSGQLDLDYNVLYDAFFKHQLKPPLLKYGELYYEGMDSNSSQINERVKARFKPGKLSIELQKALGIQNITNPPWLDNMLKLGSPPEYPSVKVTERGISYGAVNGVNKKQNWGHLVDDLDSDFEKDDIKKGDNKEEDDDDNGEYKAQEGDLLLDSYGDEDTGSAKPSTSKQEQNGVISDGRLYQILDKKKFDGKDSIYGNDTLAYDVKGQKKESRDATRDKTFIHEQSPVGGKPKKFRF